MNKFEQSTRLADKSTKVARETIERGIRSAEEATNGVKLTLLSSFAGMREFNAKLIDIAHENADEVFDFAHEIASVQTPSDLLAVWSAHAKRQFEMMTKQMHALTEVGQKVMSRNDGAGYHL
jgi:hypothetical protein